MTRIVVMTIILHTWCSLAFASNVLRVSTEKTPAGGGGKFTVVMQNSATINGLNFVLKYNPLLISPTTVTPLGKSNILTSPAAHLFDGNKIGFLLYDAGSGQLTPDSGGIFEVRYVVSDSIADSTSTEISFLEGMAADSNLATIALDYINGTIQISTSVGVGDSASAIPQSYQLCQNYPNPFNPATTIHFELPRATHVTLTVFNILGQVTLRALDEKREAGMYNVSVDGSQLASGVYFYRLLAGDFVQTKKMLLIK